MLQGPHTLLKARQFLGDVLTHRSVVIPAGDATNGCNFRVTPRVYAVRHPTFLNSNCRLVLISGASCAGDRTIYDQMPENVREIQILSCGTNIDEIRAADVRHFA